MNPRRDETTPEPRASAVRVGAALAGVVLGLIVVFGLGVMVGKRVAESVPAAPAPPAALPTETLPPAPRAAGAGAVPADRLTFYDRLSGAAPPSVPLPSGEGAAGTQAAPPAAPAAPPPAAAGPAPKPAAPARETAVAPARAAPPGPAERIKKLAGKGPFSVQVVSVRDRAAAEEAASRVRRDGFDARTVMVSIKGKTWYRVRAGAFPSKRAAIEAAGIFRSAYGFDAIAVQN